MGPARKMRSRSDRFVFDHPGHQIRPKLGRFRPVVLGHFRPQSIYFTEGRLHERNGLQQPRATMPAFESGVASDRS